MIVSKRADRVLNVVNKNMQIMEKRMDKDYYKQYFGVIFSTLLDLEIEKQEQKNAS